MSDAASGLAAGAGAMSILGNACGAWRTPVPHRGGDLRRDLPLDGAAWVTYVGRPTPTRITAVDVAEARASPGVLGVFSAADVAEGSWIAHAADAPRRHAPAAAGHRRRALRRPPVHRVAEEVCRGRPRTS
jgi:hypothetical protein